MGGGEGGEGNEGGISGGNDGGGVVGGKGGADGGIDGGGKDGGMLGGSMGGGSEGGNGGSDGGLGGEGGNGGAEGGNGKEGGRLGGGKAGGIGGGLGISGSKCVRSSTPRTMPISAQSDLVGESRTFEPNSFSAGPAQAVKSVHFLIIAFTGFWCLTLATNMSHSEGWGISPLFSFCLSISRLTRCLW
jgi:hypothetical protein